jgi:hypothetical protein
MSLYLQLHKYINFHANDTQWRFDPIKSETHRATQCPCALVAAAKLKMICGWR